MIMMMVIVMENNFNIHEYDSKMLELSELEDKVGNKNKEINTMIDGLSKFIGEQLKTEVFKVFTKQDLRLQHYQDKTIDKMFKGSYRPQLKEISYNIDIIKYLLNIYMSEYPSKLNRRYSHNLIFRIDYDFSKNNFSAHLEGNGFYSGGFIKDKTLQEASKQMVDEMKKTFKLKDVGIDAFEEKMKEVKEIIDSHTGYYVAQRLIEERG